MSIKKRTRWSSLALIACLYGLLLSVTLAAPVYTRADNTPVNPVVFSNTIVRTASVEQYWTPRRMASALSADIPAIDKQIAIPRTAPLPHTRLPTTARHSSPLPLPHTDPVRPLYSQEGKVFFSDGGKDWVCSGTALSSNNHSLVDTAGHCVADDKHFVSNWVFCPMYDGSGCHFFIAKLLATNKLWLEHSDQPSGWFRYDFGMAVVASSTSGKRLTEAFGGIVGLANIDSTQANYLAIGYPAAAPFNGLTQQKCASPVIRTDESEGIPAPAGITCDMTGGSSGGGWLISLNGQLYLNGHTSYGYTNTPDVLYSPYFDSTWFDLFRATQSIAV